MSHCIAVDKFWKGRRELWAICRLPRHHEGSHHDPRYKGHYWEETFRAFEFEPGRPRKVATKKAPREVRTTEMHITKAGQKNMFRKSDLETAYLEDMVYLDAFVAAHLAEHSRMQDEVYGEYRGEF